MCPSWLLQALMFPEGSSQILPCMFPSVFTHLWPPHESLHSLLTMMFLPHPLWVLALCGIPLLSWEPLKEFIWTEGSNYMRHLPNMITFKNKTLCIGASVTWSHESHLQSEHALIAKREHSPVFLLLSGLGKWRRWKIWRMFPRSDLAVTHWVLRSMRKLFIVVSLLLSQAAPLEGRKDNQFIWKTGKTVPLFTCPTVIFKMNPSYSWGVLRGKTRLFNIQLTYLHN